MAPTYARQRVWDPLIRIWHWLLAISVIGGWLLGEYRDFDTIAYHMYLGYTTGGLVLLRILWGIVGPPPVRFRTLWSSLSGTRTYLGRIMQRAPSGVAGHNPLGALSVFAMLLSLAVQVATGLFSEDDGLFSEGPLAGLVSSGTRATLGAIHHQNARVLLVLVGLHVAAILFYLIWKKENLVRPMISGWKVVRRDK